MTEQKQEGVVRVSGVQRLELDAADVQVIVTWLRKAPYESVANTLDKIKAQVRDNDGGVAKTVSRLSRVRAPEVPPQRVLRDTLEAAERAKGKK